jgi:hypothetical protein
MVSRILSRLLITNCCAGLCRCSGQQAFFTIVCVAVVLVGVTYAINTCRINVRDKKHLRFLNVLADLQGGDAAAASAAGGVVPVPSPTSGTSAVPANALSSACAAGPGGSGTAAAAEVHVAVDVPTVVAVAPAAASTIALRLPAAALSAALSELKPAEAAGDRGYALDASSRVRGGFAALD